MGTIQDIISKIIAFINGVFVPFIFALAFAFFLFGVFQFFFVKGADPKARAEGRGYMVGSIVAFAVMVSVWGLVNLVSGSILLNKNQPKLPTFDSNGGNSNTNSNTSSTTDGGIQGGPA